MRRLSPALRRPKLVRGAVSSLAVVGLTSAALATAGTAVASQRTPARSARDARFVQTVTSANRNGDTTFINNSATNGKPNALLFVTPNWNPRNTRGGKYLNHPIGVWYDSGNRRWGIFTEDATTMPLGRAFNVLVVPRASRTAFQVTASSTNIRGDSLLMNHSLLNHHPGILLQVTQIWNRPGRAQVYNDHNIGVWYDSPEWAIFQQDTTAMTLGASFNVLVGASGTGGALKLIKAKSSNTVDNFVLFSSPNTNNHPGAMVFATPDWNPGNIGGTYDNAPIGVWYDKGVTPHLWAVFNQDLSNMPAHAAFNLLIFSTR